MITDYYDPKSEYHVDVESPEVQERIKEAQKTYETFLEEFQQKLDLGNPESIEMAYAKAEQEGIFKKAQEVRELIFGKDIHFYGVSYLWDKCGEHCMYCPLSVPSRLKMVSEGKEVKDKKLSIDEAVKDTIAVMDDGHRHICYLTGSIPGKEKYADEIIPYLTKVIEETKDKDLKEIILNVEPLDESGFKKIADAVREINGRLGTHVSIQFRVFQETYNRETYKKMHPRGTKSDYDFRYNSQVRALKAGFDNIGLGVLFGLHNLPLEEIENLKQHAEKLEKEFGKIPARICLPSANELTKISVLVPHKIERGEYEDEKKEVLKEVGLYEKVNELIYALARLAMPKVNIVSSERDTPAMIEILDKYATCTTLNVHPGVGDNMMRAEAEAALKTGEVHKQQTTVFPRNPERFKNKMRERGYNPIID